MKTLFPIKTLATVLLMAGWQVAEAAEGPMFGFNVNPIFFEDNPFWGLECQYPDALKSGIGESARGEITHQLELSKATSSRPSDHERCAELYSNLTNLGQQSVQRQVGKVLSEIQCEPDAEVEISFDVLHNENVRRLYPNISHENVVRRIRIENCLTQEDIDPRTRRPRLDENGDPIRVPRPIGVCSAPCRGCPGNGLNTIVEYEDMMNLFRRCRDAVNKIVEDEKLIEQWARRGLLGGGERAAKESLAGGGGLGSRELGVMLEAGFGTEALLEELEREGYRGGTDAVTLRGLREAGADARLIGWLLRNGNGGAGR